jgi:hypothetical protein
MRNILLSALALTAVTASSAPAASKDSTRHPPVTIGLGRAFELALGQKARLGTADHLTIVFSRVLEDSRCPANALCVWAGNARIELRLASVTQAPASVQLNTFLPPNAAAYGSYRISLLALQPYPGLSSGQPIAPKTYTATLLVKPR